LKRHKIEISHLAEKDLEEIWLYIAENDHYEQADNLLTKLETLCASLSHLPERGHNLPEMQKLGITEFREIHYKPYRIIYEIQKHTVYILTIIDGRRDIEETLRKRLLHL
jgi:toxin ParE1/3/4